ncbi:hypothetical protein ACJX0J_008210, partial [Zea mays]
MLHYIEKRGLHPHYIIISGLGAADNLYHRAAILLGIYAFVSSFGTGWLTFLHVFLRFEHLYDNSIDVFEMFKYMLLGYRSEELKRRATTLASIIQVIGKWLFLLHFHVMYMYMWMGTVFQELDIVIMDVLLITTLGFEDFGKGILDMYLYNMFTFHGTNAPRVNFTRRWIL